jgi:micrococcal nuclease
MSTQRRTITVIALACLLVLAGCSSASGVGTVTPTTASATTAATETTATPIDDTTTAIPSSTSTPSSPIAGGETRTVTVIEVTDGDTVDVRFANGTVETVRLLGVDTPETAEQYMDPAEYGIPDTSRGRDWLLRWGENAKEFATQRLAGEQVTLVFDPESDKRGYYGRLLAYICDDGESFGTQLLERGLARVYTGGTFSRESDYLAIEADAQAANEGLWGFGDDPASTATETPTTGDGDGTLKTPTPSNDGDLPDPYDCSDFDSQDVAQQWFENHNPAEDPSSLDSDGDSTACESL